MAYTPGKGSLLQLSISASFTTVAQITKFTPPASEMGTVETTIITDAAKTFMATILDSGEANFTIEWDPANATHAELWRIHQSGELASWKIIFNDAGACVATFSAILTKFPIDEVDVESVVQIPVTLRVSGTITITP